MNTQVEVDYVHKPEYRGRAIMTGSRPDQRAVRRYFLGMSAQFRVNSQGNQHNAYIRDWSWAGMFLYSHWVPDNGAPVELVLTLTNEGRKPVLIRCLAKVVRIERGITGAATGLALAFSRYEVLRQGAL